MKLERDQVSSPHRYCRNFIDLDDVRDSEGVSSPHRYCRNDLGVVEAPDAIEFQALIGTVETPQKRLRTRIENGFQALIGTVETPEEWPLVAEVARFKPS